MSTLSQPLVSVVVVLFNAEKTLKRAMDSLIVQTYANLEILVIDDGSTDGSPSICDGYARTDSRVHVIHQSNGGVSRARQTGLDQATGLYITHLDADDWINPDMIEKMVRAIEEADADLLMVDYYEEFDNGTRRCKQNPGDNPTAPLVLRKLFNFDLMGFCWNKLYRTDLCRKIGYHPDNIHFREDELFNARFFTLNPKIAYLKEAFYHYDRSEQRISLSRADKAKTYDTQIFLVSEYEKLAGFCNVDEKDRVGLLFRRKKEILYDAVFIGKYSDLTLFPEIHPIVKANAFRDYWDFCLSVGLKGFPRLAHLLFRGGRVLFEWRKKLLNRF